MNNSMVKPKIPNVFIFVFILTSKLVWLNCVVILDVGHVIETVEKKDAARKAAHPPPERFINIMI